MKLAPLAKSRTDRVACRLREEIIAGTAAPGTLLAEAAVARRLGVSRVPVREALFRLETEGLVKSSSTGRTFVRTLTATDFEELFVLRLALEPLAARLAAARLRSDLSPLRDNVAATAQAATVQEVTRLDLDFHDLILIASGNTRLAALWRSLRGQWELWLGQLHRSHQLRTQETQRETVQAHQKIIDCFSSRTPAACERLLREHILGWRRWLPVTRKANPS